QYDNIRISSGKMKEGESLTVSVDVTNTGAYDGAEVVQLYIRDLVGSVTRPVRELKDFQKVMFRKGEKKTVTFTIDANDLKFYNSDLQWVAEPGMFKVFLGGDSNARLEADFELVK
ncbi:MAG TPA: fibronectin type III-like domain-contianing protein, partial [Flavobacterium sp.]|nr:fibronectin type III-like domain-contianing protein [Flavobacterium sp.]